MGAPWADQLSRGDQEPDGPWYGAEEAREEGVRDRAGAKGGRRSHLGQCGKHAPSPSALSPRDHETLTIGVARAARQVLFNGEASFIKKFVDSMRPLAARKFADAAKNPPGVARAASGARPGGGRAAIGLGNVRIGTLGGEGAHFITPQMRLQLLESAVRLRDEERVQLGQLAASMCPNAVEDLADGREIKIDVDALDPKSFLKLDMHVRRMLAMAAVATKPI